VNGFNDPHAKVRQVAILTPEQVETFLRVVDPDFLPFFCLSAFSGLRREEIIRLDWSEVKLDRNLIDLTFTKSKNRRRKLIEVSENLKQWLSPFARESGSVMPKKKLQLAFERAAEAAGVSPWPQNGLRHSFCSHAVTLRGVRVDEHASRPLRADVAEALLGGGGPGDGGEVLGHPPLKSIPRTRTAFVASRRGIP
jgi:integrase